MTSQRIIIPFDQELLPSRKLSFGKLTCIYEHGKIRYLRYGQIELIRMIYFAVRDEKWNTAPGSIQDEVIQTFDNGFVISFTSVYKLNQITYRADIVITADNDTISFDAKGEAQSSFKRNRIGICVLHPIRECQGTEVTVITPNGNSYNAQFPILISPHQPFNEIREMHLEVKGGISAKLRFEGDIFETEDQRNWADSSFKTYSTPLDIPLPVLVNVGDQIEQNVLVQFKLADNKHYDQKKSRLQQRIPFPNIGYACSGDERLSTNEIELLKQVPFDHYRVELHFLDFNWKRKLEEKLKDARMLGAKIELVVHFTEHHHGELEKLLEIVRGVNTDILSILVLQMNKAVASTDLMEFTYKKIKEPWPHIQVGYGTDGYFADLNRNRPSGEYFDFVSFSLSPQVHASDTRSVLENLERQSDLIETARSFIAGKKIHISPISFTSRTTSDNGLYKCQEDDVRQHSSFGALWTLCTIQNLAEAERLTFYQVTGKAGLISDPQKNAGQSPLYMMLKTIKAFNPKWIVRLNQEENFLPEKIVLENDLGDRLEIHPDAS